MIYEFLEPDDQDLINWTDENFCTFDENFFDEQEAIEIAQYNYECRVYGEKEKQKVWRAL